jgi:hypothetical protein
MAAAEASRAEPETAAQWWERVRAEHGPPPQSLRDLYREIRTAHAARTAAEAAAPSSQKSSSR